MSIQPLTTTDRRAAAPQIRPTASPSPPGGAAPLAACNICGGQEFKPGPNQRLAQDRIPPRCAACGSFERHRIVRQIFDRVRPSNFARLSAIQFGRDRGIAGGWFGQFRRAEEDAPANKTPSLSLSLIGLADASVDVVIANYLLESQLDYRAALREMGRVISDHGFAFIAVQSAHLRKTTQEVPPAAKDAGDHQRSFGQDLETELASLLPDLHVIRVVGRDPATQVEGWGYFITIDDDFAAYLFERQIQAKFVNIRKIMG